MKTKKAALLILDGWGLGPDPERDAIQQAKTPFYDQLLAQYPHSELVTYGDLVGLPTGQMGNSEVGHLNIGAGRIVYQDFAKINRAIATGELAKNQILKGQVEEVLARGKDIHLFGLLSDGGVHSHIDHLKALIDILEKEGAREIFVHAFLDGRDTDPQGGLAYVQDLERFLDGRKTKLASVIGRYYAMDRDNRWERIKLAYDLMIHGIGTGTGDVQNNIRDAYANGTTDEFMEAYFIEDHAGKPVAKIAGGDLAICFNFRTDRPRQISQVLTQRDFPDFDMHKLDIAYVTMTTYDASFQGIHVLFEKDNLRDTLGEVLSNNGASQLRMAETEKYPHVTFFLSGGREAPFSGEERIVVPSPKVATYDLQPSMSAFELNRQASEHVDKYAPDFICLNFANADMVGHTGNFSAAQAACEAVDECLSTLVPHLVSEDYAVIIIADHGNSDYMINEDGSPNTAHTTNPVPCIYVGHDYQDVRLKDGKLADVAPTILHLMQIESPEAMTGEVLIDSK
ncbi:MAG: 2,3-bisphosphoglycerate-independent phosphoglycerate mutase [Saprospiraceae bacterium]|nr:2,3-bisphosphoglycerate-independent phosphoglycerate mutase [Saprospiraceae bacterium]